MDLNVKEVIETTLKAEIVKALNAAPEAIEKLVKAALEKEVDKNGGPSAYGRDNMPYLDWLVGDEIRSAARGAVREIVEANLPQIREAIQRRMSADDMADAFAKHIMKSAADEWRININFEAEKN